MLNAATLLLIDEQGLCLESNDDDDMAEDDDEDNEEEEEDTDCDTEDLEE